MSNNFIRNYRKGRRLKKLCKKYGFSCFYTERQALRQVKHYQRHTGGWQTSHGQARGNLAHGWID